MGWIKWVGGGIAASVMAGAILFGVFVTGGGASAEGGSDDEDGSAFGALLLDDELGFGEEVAVYKVGDKMFALVPEKKEPISVSLKCDPQLAQTLREKYESVMPGYHLNKKHWNTIVLSGQLSWEEIQALVRHSYNLVAGV